MKKIYLLLLTISALQVNAQTNGDFENWTSNGTYEDPNGWSSSNFFVFLGDTLSCYKSTNAYSGQYSVLLKAIKSNFLGDTIPGVLIQKQAYSSKPNSFRFAYHSIAPGGDTALAAVDFYKGDTEDPANRVGGAELLIAANLGWKKVEEDITWTSLDNPDTMIITFFSAESGGSQLYLDDVSLSIFSAGIADSKLPFTGLYFNQNGDLNLSASAGNGLTGLQIFDISGKSVFQYSGPATRQFQTAHLPAGIYTFTVQNGIETPSTSNKGKLLKH